MKDDTILGPIEKRITGARRKGPRHERQFEETLAHAGREHAQISAAIAPLAERAAGRIWAWLERLRANGTVARIARIDAAVRSAWDQRQPAAPLVGPIDDRGADTNGRSGSTWVDLALDRCALVISHRTGPASGGQVVINSAAELATIAPGVLARLAEDIASGAAWRHIAQHVEGRARGFETEVANADKSIAVLDAEVDQIRAALGRLAALDGEVRS